MHPIPHQGSDVANDVTEDRRHNDKRNGCGKIKGTYRDSKIDNVCPEDKVIEDLSDPVATNIDQTRCQPPRRIARRAPLCLDCS